jgi:hypothetical protein
MTTSTNAAALAMFRLGVAAAINRSLGLRFIPSRYPYTYAADFLRGHPDMVPAWLRDELDGSRGSASQVRTKWAERLGIDDREAAEILANAYLEENKVEDVPNEIRESSRDPHNH